MTDVKATVIVPTTGDRGPLLQYSVESVLNQTTRDIEVFIIGDGVNSETREIIRAIAKRDSRVRFFDHPKHVRRGEEYRHEAISEAKGSVVCYLCDRDIMLPKYVENVLKKKDKYNFFLTTYYTMNEDRSVIYSIFEEDYIKVLTDKQYKFSKKNYLFIKSTGIRLSSISHTLEYYRSLPYGWRTTPPEEKYTDIFMAEQLLNAPKCKLFLNIKPPGFLYFSRGTHPGWPVSKRLQELRFWYKLVLGNGRIGELLLCPFLVKGFVKRIIIFIKSGFKLPR